MGVSFAADVIKRHRQSILVLRECTTSYTASCLIPDERHDTLRDALTRLIIGLHPLDGPRAIVRVDPAPGFASISSNDSPKHLNVTIEVGRVKNKNKNPVAEKAVRELEEELIRQEPGGRPVSEVGLAIAIARLNSRLRCSGLSFVNCGLSGISSSTNSCHSPILNLYSPNMTCVLLTIPSARCPRTSVDLFQIHHHSKLEILSTSSQTRTSSSPPTPHGVSWRNLVVPNLEPLPTKSNYLSASLCLPPL